MPKFLAITACYFFGVAIGLTCPAELDHGILILVAATIGLVSTVASVLMRWKTEVGDAGNL